jgi:hypothetical protein
MVVSILGMFEHMLQIADECAVYTRRDGGLVHVQGDREPSRNLVELNISAGKPVLLFCLSYRLDSGFPA